MCVATLPQKEETLNPFKYTGEVYDEETGLYYLRARYYDPSMRRFLNEDTYEGQIDNPLSLNLYTYVENNPLIYVDPTGHMSFKTYWYISRGSQDGFLNIAGSTASALFKSQTYKSIYGVGKGLYNGNISLGDLGNAFGSAFIEPFNYLIDHADHIFNGNPSKDESYAYGRNYAEALFNLQGAMGTAAGVTKLILKAPSLVASMGAANIIKAVPKLESLASSAVSSNRPIIGILRANGQIDAFVQPENYGAFLSHKQLGLTKGDLGFGLSYYDGQWSVRGSGYASANGWAQPTPEQAEMIKKLFGVGD